MEFHRTHKDVVSRLIGECHRGREAAEGLYNQLVTKENRRISLDGEELTLTEAEVGEFVQRYSAEVAPTLWESKRRKDQI
ncbi:MAG: hypothetical protein IH614_14050 [Desulfuromonadales bacterium]|nr:hypothetical protein [Desulfuromonadales bacterium]